MLIFFFFLFFIELKIEIIIIIIKLKGNRPFDKRVIMIIKLDHLWFRDIPFLGGQQCLCEESSKEKQETKKGKKSNV